MPREEALHIWILVARVRRPTVMDLDGKAAARFLSSYVPLSGE